MKTKLVKVTYIWLKPNKSSTPVPWLEICSPAPEDF
jgi:hypothetical protein